MASPHTNRRWFRFRLRTLLIVMLLFGVALAPVAWQLDEIRRQRIVVEEILEHGGTVKYASYGDVIHVDLKRSDISDLSSLKALAKLERLWLYGTPVSDLSPLRGLTQLEDLHFADTQVSDLSPLRELTNLGSVYLTSTQVTDKEVADLQTALPTCKITR